jgi:hypothetical protein
MSNDKHKGVLSDLSTQRRLLLDLAAISAC